MSRSVIKLVKEDSWLAPYEEVIRYRQTRYQYAKQIIDDTYGSLGAFGSWHKQLGLQRMVDAEWRIKEWLPEAEAVSLIGDFNDWDPERHPLELGTDGIWFACIADGIISEGQRYKLRIRGQDGVTHDRIPALAVQVVQDAVSHDFSAVVPSEEEYAWQCQNRPVLRSAPLIYEAHVGISGEERCVHSYRHFAEEIIPRIVKTGYNTIQLMAVAEHPYYGSFGYHVSSFFAPSSRFGSPNDLRYLIDTAHQAGLVVLLDVVHSHAVKNIAEGLNNLDGSGALYFHGDERGEHPEWDSKCFDYGREQVQRFLLSNIRYWMEEFRFDGFRFDGVTSMLYWHRGQESFESYEKYFDQAVDNDAILYLQLATTLARELNPWVVLIAEDMSGMPGLCRPIQEGGIGFTHRLAMGIPDYWIKTLKEKRDEDWDLDELWHMLQNRRRGEAHIAYAESHDQALVGDQSLAFRLMDEAMYWHMEKGESHPVIERGMALHKMIRLLTFCAGGEGYLTFMGNEFGHPEWLDFPREGNEWSYHYARRQWSLVDHPELRYHQLWQFEQTMLSLPQKSGFMKKRAECVRLDQAARIIVIQRGNLLFVYNLSIDQSYEGSEVWLEEHGVYEQLLDSDALDFGGHGRVQSQMTYHTIDEPPRLKLYLPSRTALVLQRTSHG